MPNTTLFDVPAGILNAGYLAEVVSVKDRTKLGRVQVRLLNFDGVSGQDGPVWARVAAPFAGKNRGAFMVPDVGDEVLVIFLNGDPRLPVVVGGLWNGRAPVPETLGKDGDRVDRWTIVGKAGTRIAIVEDSQGKPTISFTTPGKVTGTLTDEEGGKIEFKVGGTNIKIDNNGVMVRTQGTVTVNASEVKVTSGQVNVNALVSSFTGIVKCDVLDANTVMSKIYQPGAGNVW